MEDTVINSEHLPVASRPSKTSNGINKRHRSPSSSRHTSKAPSSDDDDEPPLSKRRRKGSRKGTESRGNTPIASRASTPVTSRQIREEPEQLIDQTKEEGEVDEGDALEQVDIPMRSERTVANQTAGALQNAPVSADSANGRTPTSALSVEELSIRLPDPLIAPPVIAEGGGPGGLQNTDNQDFSSESFPQARMVKYKRILEEECSGNVTFRLAHNDGRKDNLILLSRLKAVIQVQLPKMPREYISRVVYSREHYSYVIIRKNTEVIGGITFRLFAARKFAEIVFLAVLSGSQTAGYGARLMAHFKDHVREAFDVQHLLTYADNFAIGFFKKQGFTDEITLDRAIWVGYIKDYEGATLLQCTFLPKVRYLDVFAIYAAQRKAVFQKIKELSMSHIIYPGLEAFKSGATHVDPSDIPGLQQAGWTPELEARRTPPTAEKSPLYRMLWQLLTELRGPDYESFTWAFLRPVSGVPGYYDAIKHPMDLQTMSENLDEGKYTSWEEFWRDFQLIVSNCKFYNGEQSDYTRRVNRLERVCKERAKQFAKEYGVTIPL